MRINEIAESSSEDRFKKYIRPVVKTTPKIEKTTNPSGRTTDHIEWKVTTPTGEIHRYKSKKQAQEHYDSFGQQGVAEYGPAATAALQQGQHPIQVAAADRKDQENTLNINRSAMKAQQDVANGLDPTQTAAGNGVAEAAAPVTHRIGLTVTDPNHPMVSKRGETYQKSVRVTGPDREAAINQAIAHHRRKGYKVHDHHYLGTVDQGVAEGSVDKKPYPKTWHDVDPKIGKLVDKMSPEEKVKKGYSNPSILKKKKEQGVTEAAGATKHRIGLTVTDPNHPMVSKRGETYQKSVRVTGDDREKAINSAIAHYRRKGYKVHDHNYMGTVDQGVAEAFPNPGSGSTGSSKEDKRIAAALRKKHIPTTPNDKKKGVAEGWK